MRYRLLALALGFGVLGLSACSSCSQTNDEATSASDGFQQATYVCGTGTHRDGNQCVPN